MDKPQGGPPPIAIRSQRVQTAVSCNAPDRVPFMPCIQNWYAMGYGVTIQDAMNDITIMKEVMDRFLPQYDPDLVYTPNFFPIEPMEFAGYKNARWPGETYNLPPDTAYQYIDETFLKDEDWDEYLKDPSAFLLKKVLAKRYTALAGLELLNVPDLCTQAIYSLAGLAVPPVKQALENMIKAGEITMKHLMKAAETDMYIVEKGYPIWGAGIVSCPFDDFADNIRGYLNTQMDLITQPEKVYEAVSRWGDVSLPSYINKAKMMHAQYAFIPLHGAMDTLMSVDNFNKHFWPHLKRTISAIVDAGMTPIVLCEGPFYTRMETLKDVPKGKVVYYFEETDFRKAKDILGGTACIAGGMPTQLLMKQVGTKQLVEDEVKKVMDKCGAGGGFMWSNSIAIENVEHELMETWRESIDKYCCY